MTVLDFKQVLCEGTFTRAVGSLTVLYVDDCFTARSTGYTTVRRCLTVDVFGDFTACRMAARVAILLHRKRGLITPEGSQIARHLLLGGSPP